MSLTLVRERRFIRIIIFYYYYYYYYLQNSTQALQGGPAETSE